MGLEGALERLPNPQSEVRVVSTQDIVQARERVGQLVARTPCSPSSVFEELTGAKVFLKFENLQKTGSFKERGAANKLLSLTREERARGAITASAGNHAQGVAYHAGRLGIPATIVMPEHTPLIKVSRTRAFGARVVLAGATFDEAYAQACRIQEEEEQTFVHPFDDAAVIAGQGTVGLELLEQAPGLEAAIVPIGGGGLISGIAVALKEAKPHIRLIGVQCRSFASMKASVEAGEARIVAGGRTIADGIAVKRPGELTLRHVQRYVDEIVTVTEEEIANAILALLEKEKTVAEGAGAAALAALLHGHVGGLEAKETAVILSGGNIDVTLLSRIIERGLVKEGRLVRMIVTVDDRPGGLAGLTHLVAEASANVIEIHHDRNFGNAAMGETDVELTLETRGHDHIAALRERLEGAGYRTFEKS